MKYVCTYICCICSVRCRGHGPLVKVSPKQLSWGVCPVLTSLEKTLTVVNQSLIPAFFTCNLVSTIYTHKWTSCSAYAVIWCILCVCPYIRTYTNVRMLWYGMVRISFVCPCMYVYTCLNICMMDLRSVRDQCTVSNLHLDPSTQRAVKLYQSQHLWMTV